jgi:uncharacterized protein (TIGR02246 family)
MRAVIALGTLCLLVGSAAASAQPGALAGNDVAAIRAASNVAENAANSANWTAWANIYGDNALFFPPNAKPLSGRAAIEAWMRAYPPVKNVRLEPLEIEGRGDLAVVRGRYSLVVVAPNQPERADSGNYLEIWRRQNDGAWKITRDIFNSSLPLPSR